MGASSLILPFIVGIIMSLALTVGKSSIFTFLLWDKAEKPIKIKNIDKLKIKILFLIIFTTI